MRHIATDDEDTHIGFSRGQTELVDLDPAASEPREEVIQGLAASNEGTRVPERCERCDHANYPPVN